MKFIRDHSLSLVLLSIMLIMMIASWPLGYSAWDGKDEYWKFWLSETIFSMEADVFGAILLVVLTKRLREKNSAESKK